MLTRRSLLRLGLSGVGAATLAACASPARVARDASASDAPQMSDIVAGVAPDAKESLSVISATFELLAGVDQPFAFGLSDIDNEPITNADVEVWVVPPSGERSGPYPTEFREVAALPRGLYTTVVDLTDTGPTSFVVATRDGSEAGLAAVTVADETTSQVAVPGAPAVSARTPTFERPRGVATVCTAKPACSMHDVSLDEALRLGRPVMLTFATPAYCQTAMCGPAVQVVDQVRRASGFADLAWIHVEIYSDKGKTLSQAVQRWELPSEPWLFAIGADSKIVTRADGPLLVLPEHVEEVAESLRRG